MSKVIILTDSTAYIPDEIQSKYNIKSLPLTLIWGEETFRDGIDIQPDDFYQKVFTKDKLLEIENKLTQTINEVKQYYPYTNKILIST